MLKKRLPALSVVIGLVLVLGALPLLAACASTGGTEGVKEFTVEASEEASGLKFSPATITVSQGDKVRIILKNIGPQMPHDFVIDEFGVATPRINPGQTATVEFTADQSGTFFYYCSIETETGTHRAAGMEGEITVN